MMSQESAERLTARTTNIGQAMQPEQSIDGIARTFAAGQTRRGLLKLCGVGALSAGMGLVGLSGADAKRRRRRKKRRPSGGSPAPSNPQPQPQQQQQQQQPTNTCQTDAQCGGAGKAGPFCNVNGLCDRLPNVFFDDDFVAWEGIWVRRGASNIFDVQWEHKTKYQVSEGPMTVNLTGNEFTAIGEGQCNYYGELQADGKTIIGTKYCAFNGIERDWEAYFE